MKTQRLLTFIGVWSLGWLATCGDDDGGPDDVADTSSVETGSEVGPTECNVADDCAAVLGAPPACFEGACVAGRCTLVPTTGACDDGNPCTKDDACAAGGCTGVALGCEDDNTCTTDFCAAGVGCVHLATGGGCDDGNACTTGDRCVDGACMGLAVAGCDGDTCGDLACTGAETCASCPADCSPIGSGACGPTCDPKAAANPCTGNFACVASASDAAQGACLGQPAACDVDAQTGCAAGETCLPLAGPGVVGVAFVCVAAKGDRAVGEACGAQADCGPKLVCAVGICRATCDSAVGTCPDGACRDVSVTFALPTKSLGICDTGCGDGACDGGETCATCAEDCGACTSCGDGRCELLETCRSCQEDCGVCGECGNGICQSSETCLDCPADCGACPFCGDGICGPSERCGSCEDDCGACVGTCGDAVCQAVENCTTCDEADCGSCPVWACGDGACDPTEDCVTCPGDCGACVTNCGDGRCEYGENCRNCLADCALVAGAGCGAACDPTLAIPGCGTNEACLPTAGNRLFAAAFSEGRGVCAAGCAQDADCASGEACLGVERLDIGGVCGPACAPGVTACGDGATCVPKPENPDDGVCIAAGACSPFVPADPCGEATCVSVAGAAELGVCLSTCRDGCGGVCHLRTGAAWHEGTCVGGGAACNAAAQTGCAAGRTCLPVGGPAIGGSARVCTTDIGAVARGGDCSGASCAVGLLCVDGICKKPCVPGQSTCGGPVCPDRSADFGQAVGSLGLCP